MIRQKLDIHTFMRSEMVPPADQEEYIFWQYQHMLLTEAEAVKQIAEYRRQHARFATAMIERDAAVAAKSPLSVLTPDEKLPSKRRIKTPPHAE